MSKAPKAPSATPPLTPQVPGETPVAAGVELAPLLELDLIDLVAELADLTDPELGKLRELEEAGEDRLDVIAALDTEQLRRAAPAELTVEPTAEPAPPAHEEHPHRHLRADQVDRATLRRPALTRDGWVMPLPAAHGES